MDKYVKYESLIDGHIYFLPLFFFSGNKKSLGSDGDNSYALKTTRKGINTNGLISINKKNANLRPMFCWSKAWPYITSIVPRLKDTNVF